MGDLGVRVDTERNRLYITISGKLEKQDLLQLYLDVKEKVAELSPGFTVVNDLSGCTLASLNGIPTFKKLMDHLVQKKVGLVVRIISEDNIVFRQLLNIASRMQGYRALYVTTMAEAEEKLEQITPHDGTRIYLRDKDVGFTFGNSASQGTIINMSTSGCAIQTDGEVPEVAQTVHLKFKFEKSGALMQVFNIASEVIWLDESRFAVNFTDLDDTSREHLWLRLVEEAQQDIQF